LQIRQVAFDPVPTMTEFASKQTQPTFAFQVNKLLRQLQEVIEAFDKEKMVALHETQLYPVVEEKITLVAEQPQLLAVEFQVKVAVIHLQTVELILLNAYIVSLQAKQEYTPEATTLIEVEGQSQIFVVGIQVKGLEQAQEYESYLPVEKIVELQVIHVNTFPEIIIAFREPQSQYPYVFQANLVSLHVQLIFVTLALVKLPVKQFIQLHEIPLITNTEELLQSHFNVVLIQIIGEMQLHAVPAEVFIEYGILRQLKQVPFERVIVLVGSQTHEVPAILIIKGAEQPQLPL